MLTYYIVYTSRGETNGNGGFKECVSHILKYNLWYPKEGMIELIHNLSKKQEAYRIENLLPRRLFSLLEFLYHVL